MNTFLNTLPEDTLRKIWGIAFDTPQDQCEDDEMLISRLSLMTTKTSPFSTFAAEQVDQLTLDMYEDETSGLNTVLLNSAVTEYDSLFAQRIISHCGPKFTKLQVYSVLHYDIVLARSFAASVSQHCPEVRILDLAWVRRCRPWRVTVNKVLEMLGPQLEALGVNCMGDSGDDDFNSASSDDSIQSTDTDVAEREFARFAIPTIASSCRRLKSFSFSGTSMSVLSPLWDHIGASLEELVLTGVSLYPSWYPVIDELETKCRKLTSISLTGDSWDHEKFAGFVSSYGSQLKEADLGELSGGLCELVLQSCPNLSVSIEEFGNDYARLKALGHQLRKLEIMLVNMVEADMISAISKDCTQIEWMKAESDAEVDVIPLLFAGEKRKLTYLELECNNMLDGDSMETMANVTGALETFIMKEFLINKDDEFDVLARQNLKLQTVELVLTQVQENELLDFIRMCDIGSGIAKSFNVENKLQSIKISNADDLDFDAPITRWSAMGKPFLPFSQRGIKVNLFGKELRPYVVY